MPVYKDEKRGTWYVRIKQKDWTGKSKSIWKRGFSTKREASQWELDFRTKDNLPLDMSLNEFAAIYMENMEKRIKESTMSTKRNIIEKRILPYLGKKKLRDITNADVIMWQNEMLNHIDTRSKDKFTKSYLKTLHNQLSAILNYAVKYYGLSKNPAQIVGNMGTDKDIQMKFWTYDEYKKFSDEMMDKPIYYYAFEILYWCGIREGELLALVPSDFNFEKKTLTISKTFHHLNGRDYVTDPKTRKSNRVISVPDFLIEEVKDYIKMIYKPSQTQRMFQFTKSNLTKALQNGAKKAGVKRIRVHDLRHSHVSLLISQGYSAVAIADRVGHESIDITYRYAHLFPTTQTDMANSLNEIKENSED